MKTLLMAWMAIATMANMLVACGETGQNPITYPIFASGQDVASFTAGAWNVTLDVARVAFGPVYFCSTAAASSDLCPTALAEFASSADVNVALATPQAIGSVDGVTGVIHSAMYDYAITWLPTQQSPTPTVHAINGHSAHFMGHAQKDETVIWFVADVDLRAQIQGERVVQGARMLADVTGDNVRLDVHFEPQRWWSTVDFDELDTLRGPLTTDATSPLVINPESRAMNALVVGMTATATPTFTWSEE